MKNSQKSYTNVLPIDPHSAIICGQTCCGKTVFVLNLLETKYRGIFEHIVILCRTIKYNGSYKEREWIVRSKSLSNRSLRKTKRLYTLFYSIFVGEPTLYIIDDYSASEPILYIIDDCSTTKDITRKKICYLS